MQCTFCSGNDATCHLTKVVNGKAIEVHVCEKCIPQLKNANLVDFDVWAEVTKLALKKGLPDPAKLIEPPEEEISAKTLLINPTGSGTQSCPACGFTSDELRKTGRLGCPECYSVFSEMLSDVLSDCQKAGQHTGKVPTSHKGLRRKRLEDMLQKAVDSERFEEAAILRDQLRTIETA